MNGISLFVTAFFFAGNCLLASLNYTKQASALRFFLELILPREKDCF